MSNVSDALAEADRQVYDLALVDLRLGTESGLDLIPALLSASPWIKIVVITAYASVNTAVEAMRRGATDYIPKPFTPEQVELVTDRVAMRPQHGAAHCWLERGFGTAASGGDVHFPESQHAASL